MRLRRLEIQGFKTFAQKTVLEFVADRGDKPGLTAIVGPNGSGKSNIADAIRWVIGEQSMRLLRAKKSEDLVFSGTPKKSRSGFAEVTMTIENEHASGEELREIVITRRVYRDGKSEYEVNRKPARLSDITLLLAQSGLGQRTYSVIGQGMVDRILSASPAERKEFFDEAAGLRPYQLKRDGAEQKLESSKEKLLHADLVLRELAPRLSSLERQAKRLEERGEVEARVRELEVTYYGSRWRVIRDELHALEEKKNALASTSSSSGGDVSELKKELESLEKSHGKTVDTSQEQIELRTLQDARFDIRARIVRLEAQAETMKRQKDLAWSPLPLSKIVQKLVGIGESLASLVTLLGETDPDIARARKLAESSKEAHTDLTKALERPAPEKTTSDPELEKEVSALQAQLEDMNTKIGACESALKEKEAKAGEDRSRVFELQREMSARRDEQHRAEQEMNRIAVDLARVSARKEALFEDVRAHAPNREKELDALAEQFTDVLSQQDLDSAARELAKARSRLEWIGGIDPAVLDEYQESKTRFDEISGQTTDLKEAILSLETVIRELDATIRKRAETAFRILNKEFGVYFKKLFGGGEAALIEIEHESEVDEEGNVSEPAKMFGPSGFDITATPPGKRVKSISLLSGGERALTSIALLCAIMATNPSPFVTLDEVDAALDESNSEKFGEILEELAEQTQFIVITHNRATMSHAHVLYGVTMGDDGVSKLLSVKLEDIVTKG